jgi:flagellar basal-body rod modification protein FlgD
MEAATGILNHAAAARQVLKGAAPMSSSTSGTGSSSSASAATISANDFLTLLVTEMKNQDPTANTDPNEYINQLVNVNSLEQLISINQTLSTAAGSGSGTTASGGVSHAVGASANNPRSVPQAAAAHGDTAPGAFAGILSHGPAARFAPGNLSVPEVNPAAQRVAQALGGKIGSA